MAANLPVRRIVLYQHGVGYFEREGEVEGSEAVRVVFSPAEAEDILRALSVLDLDGGVISAISRERSTDPSDVIDELPSDHALVGLMRQLQGRRVVVGGSPSEKRVGLVVGVETGGAEPLLVILRDDGAVNTVPLDRTLELRLLDPSVSPLADQIVPASEPSHKGSVPVFVHAEGRGRRRLLATYVTSTPGWWASYRLLLGGDAEMLQGWAHIENQSAEDWEGVTLSLAASQPLSLKSPDGDTGSQAEPSTEPEQPPVGYQYEITHEVSVRAGEAALVPFLHVPFEGGRVSLFDPERKSPKPLAAVRLVNTAALPLAPGPVTVYLHDSYVGEAELPLVEAGRAYVLPYAIDLDCTVTSEQSTELEDVHSVRVHAGVLQLGRSRIRRTAYEAQLRADADEVDRRGLELILSHRFKSGFELFESPPPLDTTPTHYHFRLRVRAGETARLVVYERNPVSQSFAIEHIRKEQISLWYHSRFIDTETRTSLRHLVELADELADAEADQTELENEIGAIYADQERLRKNIKVLGREDEALRARYLSELNQTDARLKVLRKESSRVADRIVEIRRGLRESAGELTFEAAITLPGNLPQHPS